MRIGFVSTYPPIECGIATYTNYLSSALKKNNNETFVISQFGAQGESVFPVYHPDSSGFPEDIFYTSIKMTPDIMHIQHEYGLFGKPYGIKVVELILRYKMANIPIVTTLHTVSETPKENQITILKYIINESSAIIVHEEFQKQILVKYFGSSDKIHVIEHGIREIPPINNAKEKLELQGKKILLLCGYFRPTKGFHKIIDMLPKIFEKEKDAVLLVAGKFRNIEYSDYAKMFFKKLNESPVADKIKIFRGQFPQHTFDTIISAADIMLFPYEQGAQSGILSHGFAFNKPVIVSDLPAFLRLIDRSKGGLVCSKEEEYIEKTLTLLSDKVLYKDLQENIKEYVANKAGWSKIGKQHVDVYHSIVDIPYGKAKYIYFPEPKEEVKIGDLKWK